jgi:hypothetical protein
MSSTKQASKTVKIGIPKALYQAILRIQVNEAIEFDEAAFKAASLIEPNSQLFQDAVRREAQSLAKSDFMKQLNATRKTIKANGFNEGAEYVRRSEDNFHAPCSICGQPMSFSSRDNEWEKEKNPLYNAFKSWHHIQCRERQGT